MPRCRLMTVTEIDCWCWLARAYMPAHQHCGLFYPLAWGLEASPLNKGHGRPLVLRSGTFSWVLDSQSGVHHPLSPVIRLGLQQKERKKERKMTWGVSPLQLPSS